MFRRLLLLSCLFSLTLCGCRLEDPRTGRRTIGISLLSLTNPFFKEIADNLADEAGKLGYDVIVVSGENDVARQDKQVNDFLIRKVDAIVLSPCDSKSIGQSIRAANTAGVPVFTVDIACLSPDARVVTHIATDNYSGGRQAGEAMVEMLSPHGGKIGILDFKEVESCILRVKGFKEVIDAHNRKPGAARIEVVSELPSSGSKDQGYKSMQDMLQAHPDLVAVFAINDPAALGARAALEKAERAERIRIIGFDGQPEGKQAIGEGKIYADPIQYPDQIGRSAAKTIAQYFEGQSVPPVMLIPTALYRKADAQREGVVPR